MTTTDLQEEPQSPPEEAAAQSRASIGRWLNQRLWHSIPLKYRQNFQPTFKPLSEDEVPELEIHLAWYRDLVSNTVLGHFGWSLFVTFVVAIIVYIVSRNLLYAGLPFALLLLGMVEGVREYIEYNQWRIIKTNRRLIISLPQHGSWLLIDNIEMGDLPKVIDTNWSPNPFWRLFQFFTGSRDVYLSLLGFQFEAKTAKVKDAIIIPDMEEKDIEKLKRLIFKKK